MIYIYAQFWGVRQLNANSENAANIHNIINDNWTVCLIDGDDCSRRPRSEQQQRQLADQATQRNCDSMGNSFCVLVAK